ncbi:MAG: KdsC family phosphatase [Planctomycetota bacterium]|jgi:3-deoxy-D-manno-octulosonate 8-phosphate phosphatase (KDO 8-P phosphatase)
MPEPTEHDLCARLACIKLLVLDVDGVLTDGRLAIDDHGVERKNFHVQDGSGIWLLRKLGVETAIISGRFAPCTTVRARELQIWPVIQGARDKRKSFEEVREAHKVQPDQCAYMGDDLVDIALLRAVGVSAAPQNARPEVKRVVDLVTEARGGHGAVRELAEAIARTLPGYADLLARLEVPS